MANETVLTAEGYEKLKKELEELKGPVRGRIAEAIREAKSHGDLRENAAYHEAKLNQSRLESRIADLEKTLQLAKVVAGSDGKTGGAFLGSKIKLLDLDYDDEMTISLVSSYEANPAQDLISISSPLGAALLGKVVGNEVEVAAPGGLQKYRIVELS
ncbi:MAG TPA: transcription elongation factor GreA [Fimbriimonadaceae bacterium]|jgi:transcription elongation factor GreA